MSPVHKTANVTVVFMALILNGFEGCNISVRCFKEIWMVGKVGKVGKVGEVGKVGRKGLFMPTWSQL